MGAWFQTPTMLSTAAMLALGLVAVFVEAAPLGLQADARPSPDLVFCIVAYWAARRPEAATLPAVFALGLARDLLTDVPAGLGALTLVAASEYLRLLSPVLGRRGFSVEWAAVAGFLALALALQWLGVLILLLPPPYLGSLVVQWAASVTLYAVLMLVLRGLFRFGAHRPAVARD